MFPNQIQGLVLAQKRPAVPAEAKHGVGAIMTACWAHKPSKRPAMADVINDLLHAAFQYLWDTNGRGTLTAGVCCSWASGPQLRSLSPPCRWTNWQLLLLCSGLRGDRETIFTYSCSLPLHGSDVQNSRERFVSRHLSCTSSRRMVRQYEMPAGCRGAVDAQLLVQCVAPSAETGKRVVQRQDFAARSISSLAGPDGDPVAKDVRALAHLAPGLMLA